MRIRSVVLGLALFLFFPAISQAVSPQITVQATAVTLLGVNVPISITVQLVDMNRSGMLKLPGGGIVPIMRASSAAPATTVTCGPIFGTDVVTDAYGNPNSTVYLVQVFATNASGLLNATPSLQTWYQFIGSGTIDLVSAIPVAPSFMTGPNGNVVVPGTLTASQFIATVSTGTAPLVVSSTTQVANLNSQLHGGLAAPSSAIVGISDTQALSNKTFDISANTLKTATNTAGHIPRNNGTQYVDGQLACGDLSNATGGCSTALQGTDSKLLTSGTVSGTGAALCLDANGGATTSGCSAATAQVSSATNFGTNLSSQTVVASMPVTGVVHLTSVVVVSTVGAGCSANNNNTTSTWSFTAPGGTVTTVSGGNVSFTGNGTLDGGANPGTAGVQSVVAKAGTAITYTTTSTLGSTGCSPLPQYTVYAKAYF